MTGAGRVAHLTTVDMSLRYLLEAQLVGARDAGYDVIGISAPGPDVDYVRALGVEHVALRSSTRAFDPRADVAAMRELVGVLRRLDVDILHTHNPKPGVYGRILGRLAGVPYVVNTVHGLYATPEDRLVKRLAVYGAEGLASRFSHRELVQSAEDLELLARRRLTPQHKLVHLGNGVDLQRFSPGPRTGRAELRAELGVDPAEVVIGIVARLVAEKGYRELFAAAEQLSGRGVVVAVGPDDPDRPDALPRELVLKAQRDGVRFVGHQADVAPWYAAMDLFVLPSYREGVPRGAMEAAACGLAIVATDVRGCRQVVDDGVTGLLVPPRDARALRHALDSLVADPERRAVMGAAGRRRAERLFDERDVVARVLECYADLLAGAGHGRN